MIPENKVIDIIKHFARTGEIRDQIVPFFDQNGRWCGDRKNWSKTTYKKAATVMRQVELPECRRTGMNDQGESILMTSFVWKKRRSVVVPWFEVHGSIRIRSLEAIVAVNLRSVGGDCYSNTDAKVKFPYLRRVGGNFDFQSTVRLHAPVLAEVGGSLLVVECQLPKLKVVGKCLHGCWAGCLELTELCSVGGSMDIEGAESLVAPMLEWVGFDLVLSSFANTFRACKLESVGGSVYAGSVQVFQVPRLKYVGDSLYTESAKEFYRPGFVDLVHWEMHPEAESRWKLRESVKRAMRAKPPIDI